MVERLKNFCGHGAEIKIHWWNGCGEVREQELKSKIFRVLRFLVVIPFIVGSIGLLMLGRTPLDAMYGALTMYGMNLNIDEINTWVEVARWMAPMVLAASVLTVVNSLYHFLFVAIVTRKKGSNIIYGNSEEARLLCSCLKNAVLVDGRVRRKGANHIIMMESDMNSLSFYNRNRKALENEKTYICLKELNLDAIRQEGKVVYFSVNDVIARLFWKEEYRTWETGTGTIHIALLEFGDLGQKLLNYALQLNLFSRNQKIVYHIFDIDKDAALLYENIHCMNQDELILHSDSTASQRFEILPEMDVIIITEEPDLGSIQKLLALCSMSKIYYYDPNDRKIEYFLTAGDSLRGFGRSRQIFTDEYIKTDALYRDAKQLNFEYWKLQNTKDSSKEYSQVELLSQKVWDDLPGFSKASNISEADYREVLKLLLDKGDHSEERLEELAELEHIRWCRFYFLHFWKYGIPESGDAKDSKKRIHRCLVPYKELDESEKLKDRNMVWNLR